MLDRLVCLVRRQHDYRLCEGGGRVYLHCRRCGVRTPGWETSPRVRVIPTQPPPLRLLLADVEPWPSTDASLRLLLADTDTDTDNLNAGALRPGSLRIGLADADLDRSDALPLGELEPPPAADLSAIPVSSTPSFRLALE